MSQTNMKNTPILTRPNYWNQLSPSAQSAWQNTANAFAHAGRVVCTHRPSVREFPGSDSVRRCSTGGKHGKSADRKQMNISAMLRAGYVWRVYIPRAEAIAAKREEVYCNDNH